jgi:hypothetical protein
VTIAVAATPTSRRTRRLREWIGFFGSGRFGG